MVGKLFSDAAGDRATDPASNGSETEARMDKPASKHFLAFGIF
jgi:hypothetical protein